MLRLSIGIIEVIGLASAIEVADICVKSANVTLIGYELSQGNGMVLIKIEGDVGAVTAAIQASSRVGKVLSKKVIPRPGDGIECLIKNKNTVGYEDINKNTDEEVQENEINKEVEEKEIDEEVKDKEVDEEVEQKEVNEEVKENEVNENRKDEEINKIVENDLKEDASDEKYTCNLCKDPKCPREKGDLRVNCIHHDDKDANS